MTKSDSIKNVMTALGKFQSKAVKITKDSINPHYKSKYASLSVILDEIQPILTEACLVFTQMPEGSDHLITTLFHTESGEFIEGKYDLNAVTKTPQAIGSAITYARRYSLTSILGLNIDDDDDGNAANEAKKKESTQQQPAPAPAQQTTPQQPAQQTPFNKQYTDANAISAVIATAGTVAELFALYQANSGFIDGNTVLKQAMKSRELSIKNGGKMAITDGQFSQVCDRIAKGDLTAYKSALKAFVLSDLQMQKLEGLDRELQELEKALTIKYSIADDIANMISVCRNTNQIMRLHQNNSFLIDRDGELTTKINARIKVLKTAA